MHRLLKELEKLPINPDEVYKDKGWKGWDDFLGKGSSQELVAEKQEKKKKQDTDQTEGPSQGSA
ncbi:hypothetical protein ACFL34_02945 [Candidatus Sumerlaeota bacterium]